jgi:hypothetical protein
VVVVFEEGISKSEVVSIVTEGAMVVKEVVLLLRWGSCGFSQRFKSEEEDV